MDVSYRVRYAAVERITQDKDLEDIINGNMGKILVYWQLIKFLMRAC